MRAGYALEVSRASPSHAYYRACEGRWQGPLDLVITDPAAFNACTMSWLDRMRVRSMLLGARWTGPFVFRTTVDYASRGERGEVLHTTQICKWGAVFFDSREILTLAENGRDFTLRGELRLSPTAWWRSRVVEGSGQVDETGTRATYDFPWFGTHIRQTTLRLGDLVEVTQETPWSRGVQRLRRQPT